MTFNISGGSSVLTRIQGFDISKNPSAYVVPYQSFIGGAQGNYIINEANVYGVSNKITHNNNTVYCNQPITGFTNNTPSLIDTTTFPLVTANGLVGLAGITLHTAVGDTLLQFAQKMTEFATGGYFLTGYQPGSLAKKIHDLVDSVVGSQASPDPSWFNIYNGPYTINPYLYTNPIIDLSPWTDNGYFYSCCLISPRHISFPTHAQINEGTSIIFTRSDGTTTTKTVVYSQRDVGGAGYDVGIGYLDSAVTGITPYSFLPDFVESSKKIPLGTSFVNGTVGSSAYDPLRLGVLTFMPKGRYPFGYARDPNIFNRQMHLGISTNIAGGSPQGSSMSLPTGNRLSNATDIRYKYSQWNTDAIPGDSGTPILMPTGLTTATGTPLTLLLSHTYYPSSGPGYSHFINDINLVMNSQNAAANVTQVPVDNTVYALDVINTSTKPITLNGTATTGAAWWASFNSY